VGIGLIGRDGRYLIRQRPAGTVYEGYWEFPGGKCEVGEPPAAAVRRECREETGLEVRVESLLQIVEYRYPHAWVEMFFYRCVTVDPWGEPTQGTGFLWVEAERLSSLRFPEANAPILEQLTRESIRLRRPEPGGVGSAET
jgi:8-oxo-dGTP diphosphatase